MRRARFVERLKELSPALVTALAVVLALRRLDDTDTWWHFAAGRWIVQHRAVPSTDMLSYTVPDHPWIIVQWIFDVLIYSLYKAGGPTLLVLVAGLAYGLAIALLIRHLRLALGPLAAATLALWVTVIAQERFAIRPEMISFLLLAVLLWVYATGRRHESRRLWLIPAVALLWVNCHSLFIIAVVVIGAHVAASVVGLLPPAARFGLGQEPPVARRVVATGAAALLATLVNPFGAMGDASDAARFYTRFSDLHPAVGKELRVRLFLARHYVGKGGLPVARIHLARAAALDPSTPSVLDLRTRIGR